MQSGKYLGVIAVLTIVAALITPTLAHINNVQNKQAKIQLKVQVKDAAGNPIGGARVNVWHDTWGPDTGPPDYQEETASDGTAVIPVLAGKTAELYIEINKGELWSRGNAKLSGSTVTYPAVLKKINAEDESGQINIKVHVEQEKEGSVLTSEGKLPAGEPLAGVRIVFRDRLGSPRIVAEATTGADGDATIPVVAWNYRIEAIKDGYESGGTWIYLTTKQRGLTVAAPPITLKKKAGARINVEVVVTVQNAADKTLVNGADVVLTGKGGVTSGVYRGTTIDGVARIPIKEYGRFDVEISQAYFEPINGELRILVGETQKELPPYFLKEKPKKAEAGDAVNVRVLAGDKKNAPIEGASVTVGKVSVITDANGRATLETMLGDATYVVVTAGANGYKRQTKSVQVRRGVRYTDADASATIVLEPGEDVASDDAPIRLVVEIIDSLTNQPLGKTNVQIRFKGKIVAIEDTNEVGEARIEIKGTEALPLSELRTGLKIDAYHDNYIRRDSDIVTSQLSPSSGPRIVTLHLDRDWSALQTSIAALEGKVAAWNNDVTLVAQTVSSVNKLLRQTAAAETRTSTLYGELTSNMVPADLPTGNFSKVTICRKAGETKQTILGYETDAAAKASIIKQLLDNASRAAESCQSPADANAVKANHSAAIRMVAEIGETAKKARAANHMLAALAVELNLKPSDRALESKLVEITELSRTADQAAITVEVDERRASALSKGLAGRRDALNAEIETLRKTHGIEKFMSALPPAIQKRLGDMSGLVGSRNSDVFAAPDPSAPATVKAAAERIQRIKADTERTLNEFKRNTCEIATLDDLVRNIENSLTTASVELGFHANLPTKASNCTNRSACKTLDAEIRPLIQQNNVEQASAVLARMDGLGCDTSGLKASLDAEMDREYADTISLSQQNCQFQQALDLAAQIPPKIKTRPRVARAIGEAQSGLQAQKRIELLIDKADKTTDIAAAKVYVAQARQIAAPYPCLAEMLKGGGATAKAPIEDASGIAPISDTGEETKKSTEVKTTSDGFWESINKATSTRRGNNPAPVVEEDPRDTSGTSIPITRSTRRGNDPAPIVEEDPREVSGTSTPTTRPTSRGNDPAPTVEEDPRENSGPTKSGTAANRPARRRNKSAPNGGATSEGAAANRPKRGGNNSGGGSSTGIDMSGTWIVTSYIDWNVGRETLTWRIVLKKTAAAEWRGTLVFVSSSIGGREREPEPVVVRSLGGGRIRVTAAMTLEGTTDGSSFSIESDKSSIFGHYEYTGVRQN